MASGGWPEQESQYAARISLLQEHYRSVAQREKQEKESRRFLGRKLSYLQLSDKYGLTTVVARKRAGLPSLTVGPGREEPGKPVEVTPVESEDLGEGDDIVELLEKEIDLCQVGCVCRFSILGTGLFENA